MTATKAAVESMSSIRSTERHLSVDEIGKLWGLSVQTVRNMFKDEPGVLKIKLGVKGYQTLRIPESVMKRVHLRNSSGE